MVSKLSQHVITRRSSSTTIMDHYLRPQKLNCDVLLHMMTFLAQDHKVSTLFSLMRTCRTLYACGISHILSIPIKLRGHPFYVMSFNSFMYRDLRARVNCIQSISLACPTGWECSGQGLIYDCHREILTSMVKILSLCRCHRLTRVEICGCEEWLRMDLALLPALDSGGQLPHLMVGGGGPLTWELLHRLRDRVEAFSISFSPDEVTYPDQPDPDFCDPRQFTCNFHKMDELHLRWPNFHPIHDDIDCDDVRTLSIEYHHKVDVQPLMESFPLIRNLLYYPSPLKWHQPLVSELLDTTREQNKKFQDEREDWLDLDYYGGDLLGMYALCPMGDIFHMDICMPPKCWKSLDYLLDVLLEGCPDRLTLYYPLDRDYMLLACSIANSVSHLDLTIYIGRTLCDMNNVEVELCHGITELCLSVFRLRLDWDPKDKAYPILTGLSKKRAVAAMKRTRTYFKNLDPHKFALSMLQHERSEDRNLRYIALELPYHNDALCYKVVGDGSEREVQLLTEHEGQAMLEKELPKFTSKLDVFERWKS